MQQRVVQIEAVFPGQRREVAHLGRNAGPVELSDEVAWQWSLLGIPLAWVPDWAVTPLRLSPPLLTDVRSVARGLFLVPREALGGARRTVWTVRDGVALAHVLAAWSPEPSIDGLCVSWERMVREGRATSAEGGWDVLLTEGVALDFDIGSAHFRCREVDGAAAIAKPTPELRLPVGAMAVWALLTMFVLSWSVSKPETVLLDPGFTGGLARLHLPPPPPPPVAPPRRVAPKGERGGGGGVGPGRTTPTPGAGGNTGGSVVDQLGALFDGLDAPGILTKLASDVGSMRAATSHGIGEPGGVGRNGERGGGNGDAEGLGAWGTGGTGERGRPPGSGFGDKEPGRVTPNPDEAIVMPGLSRDVVDAVIKRRLNAIRYCYQRALVAAPSLQGNVLAHITIAGDGSVSRAQVSGRSLTSEVVTGCIERVLYKLQFPEPRGAGIVAVRYPFTFASGT